MRVMSKIRRTVATLRCESRPSWSGRFDLQEGGKLMGTEARIGLILGAAACLVAVLVDWVLEELA